MTLLSSCGTTGQLKKYGREYQTTRSFDALNHVVMLMPMQVDTTYLKKVLGTPIDMGFDYRYLLDSIGEGGCIVGAVFHLDDNGLVDDKWLGEICE